MSNSLRKIREGLITQRFAVTVISILLGCSAAGWLMTELIPPDFAAQEAFFNQKWGATTVKVVKVLRLYDPFHSFWYRAVLALFFAVLLLCVITRWRTFIMRSFRFDAPGGPVTPRKGGPFLEAAWSDIAREGGSSKDPLTVLERKYARKGAVERGTVVDLFARVEEVFRSKGYRTKSRQSERSILFAAVAGRWRFLGNFLFHVGLLVITVGGMIGSFWGWSEFMYGRVGDRIPIEGTGFALVVQDFEIVMTRQMEIKSYVSSVAVVSQGGDTVRTANIEVNRPLRIGGRMIYQSSYYADDEEFDWAHIEVGMKGGLERKEAYLRPGDAIALEDSSIVLTTGRFFPDFRMGPGGPYSASSSMSNPALEVEVRGERGTERVWLFLLYPQFNTKTSYPVRMNLIGLEPVFHTGFEINANPGSIVLMAGIIVATAGLLLLYSFHYRLLHGSVDTERIVIAPRVYRWKVSIEDEVERIRKDIVAACAGQLERGLK